MSFVRLRLSRADLIIKEISEACRSISMFFSQQVAKP
jgi:hypothetical protein